MASVSQELQPPLLLVVVVAVVAVVVAVVVAALSLLAQQLPRQVLCSSAEVQRHLHLPLLAQQLTGQVPCPSAEVVVAVGEMAVCKFAVVMAAPQAAASMSSLQTAAID